MVNLLCQYVAISNAVFDPDTPNVVSSEIEPRITLLKRSNGALTPHVSLIVAGDGTLMCMNIDCIQCSLKAKEAFMYALDSMADLLLIFFGNIWVSGPA